VGVVDGDGGEHDKDIDGLSPAVKDEVEEEQHGVAELQRGDIIHRQHDGEVEEQEKGG